jgi:hypothetical protein
MSRSIHITIRNFKGLTKKEIDGQSADPHSDLNEWAKKKSVKKEILKSRRNKGQPGNKE